MNVFVRIATLTAATVALCGTAAAQQTLSFNNVNPPIVVTLTPSSTLGIATNGNVTASCVATNNVCNGMPSGGGGGPLLTVSLAASNFSTTADGNGAYPAGTTLTLTPTVSGTPAGEVCLRLLTAGTPNVSGWSGTVVAPFSAQSVTVASASSTYGFQLRCFNANGATTSNTVQVVTNSGGGGGDPPPPQCSTITAPAGYTQQTPPTEFTQVPLVTPSGQFMAPFPNSGGGQGRVVPNRNRYMSIRFQAPLESTGVYQGLARQFNWLEAQQAGFSVNLNNIYVTVSQCPGDFRIPVGTDTVPANDPTFATGCRNWRPFSQGGSNLFLRTIDYNLGTGVSDFDTCMINPGGTYYFNFILAGPTGGIVPNENPCTNQDASACGIQMQIQ